MDLHSLILQGFGRSGDIKLKFQCEVPCSIGVRIFPQDDLGRQDAHIARVSIRNGRMIRGFIIMVFYLSFPVVVFSF
jgi:hypothetical protein